MKAVSLVLPVNIHVFKEFGMSKDPKILLKGSDRMVMLAATSLGLKVAVRSIVNTENVYHRYEGSACFFHCVFYYQATNDLIGESWEQYLEDNGYKSAENILWCQKFKEMVPGSTALTYGNEHLAETCYMAAAILVNVPKWSERSPLHDRSIEDYGNKEIRRKKKKLVDSDNKECL